MQTVIRKWNWLGIPAALWLGLEVGAALWVLGYPALSWVALAAALVLIRGRTARSVLARGSGRP